MRDIHPSGDDSQLSAVECDDNMDLQSNPGEKKCLPGCFNIFSDMLVEVSMILQHRLLRLKNILVYVHPCVVCQVQSCKYCLGQPY